MFVKATDKAYFAGIIDGEGCITMGVSPLKRSGTTIYAVLRIQMCNPEAIRHLRDACGGVGSLTLQNQQRYKKNGWTPTWHWVLTCQKAATILKDLLPYLIIKRRQAELLLELATLRRQHRSGLGKANPKRQQRILQECQRLNQRGRGKKKGQPP